MNIRDLNTILTSPIVSDISKILGGILASFIIAMLARLYIAYEYRRVRKFWGWFIRKQVTIIMTEYEFKGSASDAQFAQRAGGRFLVSRGNALAMSNLLQFLSTKVTRVEQVRVVGDKSGGQRDDYQVIIGSPANNVVARQFFATLEERFDVPWAVKSDPSAGDVHFESADGHPPLIPQLTEDGVGTDYAIIVRLHLRNPIDRYVILIAGAFMYGTQAAAYAVTNKQVIDYVAQLCKGASNLMFIVKVNVTADHPHTHDIEVKYAYSLRQKNPTV